MDKVGNTYVIEPDPLNPARPFKRMIEAKDTIYDPSSVPALWRSWLNFRREEPPTEKELEAYEAKQRNLAQKVAELEEEDAKLALQEQAARQAGVRNAGPQGATPKGMLDTLVLQLAAGEIDQRGQKSAEGKEMDVEDDDLPFPEFPSEAKEWDSPRRPRSTDDTYSRPSCRAASFSAPPDSFADDEDEADQEWKPPSNNK